MGKMDHCRARSGYFVLVRIVLLVCLFAAVTEAMIIFDRLQNRILAHLFGSLVEDSGSCGNTGRNMYVIILPFSEYNI